MLKTVSPYRIVILSLAVGGLLVGCGDSASDESAAAPIRTVDVPHPHMRALVENAFEYIDLEQGLFDPVSGYPLEGFNEDPEAGVFLRSFTQITAIGKWVELAANIVAGQAPNGVVSPEEALERLEQCVETLLQDQKDPRLGANGLLVNFMGLEGDQRVGPLATRVRKESYTKGFGPELGTRIWRALCEAGWVAEKGRGEHGEVDRSAPYGVAHFVGPLAPFADPPTAKKIMALLDQRVVLVAYGDNANLTTSVAKAIGALRNHTVAKRGGVVALRGQLEAFIAAQEEGYRGLLDVETGQFYFGRDEGSGRFFGWSDADGEWMVGHQDYFVNEFRDPTLFVVARFGLDRSLVGRLGFAMRSVDLPDGRCLFTLAPWDGSAFQIFGLDLAFPHELHPAWLMILENAVRIEVDYALRHGLPGFLSESYTGVGSTYSERVGMPSLAVTKEERIETAPSLYTLGTAYQVAPAAVEGFLAIQWPTIGSLRTEHGPWEGYDMVRKRPVEFQTTAHTLSLILGALGNGKWNMCNYLVGADMSSTLEAMYHTGAGVDMLGEGVGVSTWAGDGRAVVPTREGKALVVASKSASQAGVVFEVSKADISGNLMEVEYASDTAFDELVIVLQPVGGMPPGVLATEIRTSLKQTHGELKTLQIPLPTHPMLEQVARIEFNFKGAADERVKTLTLHRFSTAPIE